MVDFWFAISPGDVASLEQRLTEYRRREAEKKAPRAKAAKTPAEKKDF